MKYLVFPANKSGKIIKGFCPTVCSSEAEAIKESESMIITYIKHAVNYHHIVIKPDREVYVQHFDND